MTNKNTGQSQKLIFENLQWHFSKTTEKIKKVIFPPAVQSKTVALEVQKVGLRRKITRLTPMLPTKTGNKYKALEVQELDSYGDYQQPWNLDSGASGHYCGPRTGVRTKKKTSNGIKVIVADGDTIDQIAEGKAQFNKIPTTAADVQIFLNMPNALISGGKLVRAGCKIILDDPEAVVINKRTNEVVMKAEFDPNSSTWNVFPDGKTNMDQNQAQQLGLEPTSPPKAGVVINLANNTYQLKTQKEIVEFYNVAGGWPVKKTWIAAIKRNVYASWPGLDEKMVYRHLGIREPTVLGHLHARRSGTQTTKPKIEEQDILQVENEEPEGPRLGILRTKERRVGAHLVAFDELKGYIATDLCGRYPTMSNKGNKYIFVLYDYDSNLITARPIKSNKGAAIVQAYEEIYGDLKEASIAPIIQYLDNEISKELIASIKSKNLKFQLEAPHDHRLNPAERAIQTFKNHFIAILQGCDERFPKYL